jgi:hypothetical protein
MEREDDPERRRFGAIDYAVTEGFKMYHILLNCCFNCHEKIMP